MTYAELVKELRKPGKVYMPVIMGGDVAHIAAEKNDLIDYLLSADCPNEPAPWAFYGEINGGRKMDVA